MLNDEQAVEVFSDYVFASVIDKIAKGANVRSDKLPQFKTLVFFYLEYATALSYFPVPWRGGNRAFRSHMRKSRAAALHYQQANEKLIEAAQEWQRAHAALDRSFIPIDASFREAFDKLESLSKTLHLKAIPRPGHFLRGAAFYVATKAVNDVLTWLRPPDHLWLLDWLDDETTEGNLKKRRRPPINEDLDPLSRLALGLLDAAQAVGGKLTFNKSYPDKSSLCAAILALAQFLPPGVVPNRLPSNVLVRAVGEHRKNRKLGFDAEKN